MGNQSFDRPTIPEKCRVECFMRAPTCGTRSQEEAVVDQLQRLENDERIAEFVWHVWNREVCLSSPADRTASSRETIEKYHEFRTWAAQHNRRLAPFFAERTVSSSITGDEYEIVTFPVMCLALYDGETLRNLVPTADEHRTYSVQDCLATLDTRSDSPLDQLRNSDHPAHP